MIVIDNTSTDGLVEMVKKNFPQAMVIKNSENRGLAAANKQGMAIARAALRCAVERSLAEM